MRDSAPDAKLQERSYRFARPLGVTLSQHQEISGRPVAFIFVFEGRCGSGFLRTALNTSPYVACQGERLLADLKHRSAEEQMSELHEYFDRQKRKDHILAVGLKTRLSQIVDKELFSHSLGLLQPEAFRLRRRNIMKQCLSHIVAKRQVSVTGLPHQSSSQPSVTPLQVDVDRFEETRTRLVEKERKLDRFVDASPLNFDEIWYEDILNDPYAVLEGITKRLGIDIQTLDLNDDKVTVKQTPDKLSEAITNFSELEQYYAGTPWYDALHE